MSSIGAVGGGGASAPTGAGAGMSSPAAGAAAASGTPSAGTPSQSGHSPISKSSGENSGNGITIENTNVMQMSTQSFTQLHNSCQSTNSIGGVNAMEGPQSGELDLQKIVEMMMLMMLMKMMQQMQA